ncbi:hypothetical protein VTK73DRAFT_4222 [Phialemonium thermophilum]|uniref:Uncharacterized protein n=1 Tax=Phialemonium thermophilum TaxID=223376 RepID=A0ABR3VAU8_9PEZI
MERMAREEKGEWPESRWDMSNELLICYRLGRMRGVVLLFIFSLSTDVQFAVLHGPRKARETMEAGFPPYRRVPVGLKCIRSWPPNQKKRTAQVASQARRAFRAKDGADCRHHDCSHGATMAPAAVADMCVEGCEASPCSPEGTPTPLARCIVGGL